MFFQHQCGAVFFTRSMDEPIIVLFVLNLAYVTNYIGPLVL